MNIRKLSKLVGSPFAAVILQYDVINRLAANGTTYIRQTVHSRLWGVHIKTYKNNLKRLQELGLITTKQTMARLKDFLDKEYLAKLDLNKYEQDARSICTLITATEKLKDLIDSK
jgi:hypothetical protein